jgi:glycosyltransferase involved in cell wall biosynthesis
MKIALLVPSWPPGSLPNGIVAYASQLVPALRQLGHEVLLLTTVENGNDHEVLDLRKFGNSRTIWSRVAHKLWPDHAVYASASARLTSAAMHLVSEHGIDVLEVEESFGWSYEVSGLAILPIVVRLHGPWFLHAHFLGSTDASSIRRQEREGRALRVADYIVSPSAKMLQAVERKYRLDLPAKGVIPNPLAATEESGCWNLDACDTDALLFVGRFDALKGGDLVVRVFAQLASEHAKLRLIFVGPDRGIRDMYGRDQSFAQYISSNIPQRIRSRIHFHGELTGQQVAALRPSCFVTVVASQQEMMPYAVLEAMALGCPIVATSVGGIPELIQDRHNGLLVAPNNVESMAQACRALIANPALAARLGHQAWLDCREFYSPGKIAEQTVATYQKAIDIFRSRRSAQSNQ